MKKLNIIIMVFTSFCKRYTPTKTSYGFDREKITTQDVRQKVVSKLAHSVKRFCMTGVLAQILDRLLMPAPRFFIIF